MTVVLSSSILEMGKQTQERGSGLSNVTQDCYVVCLSLNNLPVPPHAGLVGIHRSVFPICQKHPQGTSQVTTQLSLSVLALGCHPSSNTGDRTDQGHRRPASLLIRNNQQRAYPSHPSDPIIPFHNAKCGFLGPRGCCHIRMRLRGCVMCFAPLRSPHWSALLKIFC